MPENTITFGDLTFNVLASGQTLETAVRHIGVTHVVKDYDPSGYVTDVGSRYGLLLRLTTVEEDHLTGTRLNVMSGTADYAESDTLRYSAWPGAWMALQLAESVAVPAPVPAVVPSHRIPRTATDAVAAAQALTAVAHYVPDATEIAAGLQDLARWLHGGEMNDAGHEHAALAHLCGEYESVICPVFGWHPRRGESSSMMRFVRHFHATVDDYEENFAHLTTLDLLRRFLTRYDRGGECNAAVIDHARDHLESHKVPGMNELLEQFDWEPLEAQMSNFNVTMRFIRTRSETRTITEVAYVTVLTEAEDADEIDTDLVYQEAESVIDNMGADWDIDDEGDWESNGDHEIVDSEVYNIETV